MNWKPPYGWAQWLGLGLTCLGGILSLRRRGPGVGIVLTAAGGATFLAACAASPPPSYLSRDASAAQDMSCPPLQLAPGVGPILADLAMHLDEAGTGTKFWDAFPDNVLVFTDHPPVCVLPDGSSGGSADCPPKGGLPPAILPFRFYYSPTAQHTAVICAIGRVVAIAPGKVDRALTDDDIFDGDPASWTPYLSCGAILTPKWPLLDPRFARH